MNNYDLAFKKTMDHEGKYSFDKDDFGGETYMGISRKYNPNWDGWIIIDGLKDNESFPSILNNNEILNLSVKNFYKINYWNKFLGDNINNINITNELFDTSINMGVSRASIFLQQSLNYLNRNGSLFKDILEDGKIGSNTLNALNIYLNNDDEIILLKIMNILQGIHYLNYMKKDPIQEKYARGWLKRIEISKGG